MGSRAVHLSGLVIQDRIQYSIQQHSIKWRSDIYAENNLIGLALLIFISLYECTIT